MHRDSLDNKSYESYASHASLQGWNCILVRIQLTKLVVLSWALGIPADGIVIAAALSTQARPM